MGEVLVLYVFLMGMFFELTKGLSHDQVALLVVALILVALLGYFLPTMVAQGRSHRNRFPIFLVNLLFGWSFLGWAVALVWAFTANVEERA